MAAPRDTPPAPGSRWAGAALALLVVASLGLRASGTGWGLPQVYEEATPYRVAWSLWGWGPTGGGLHANPHFFRYPSLVIYLQFAVQAVLFAALRIAGTIQGALDFRVLHATDPTVFLLAGRMLSVLFGTATVPLTHALTRRLAGAPAAWLAAGLVAVHPTLVARAQEIEVDIPLTCLVTAGLVLALRLQQRPDRRTALIAGAVAGLAAGAKYTGAILLLPITLAVLTRVRLPAGAARGRGSARPAPVGVPAAALIAVAAIAAALTFAAVSPYVLLDPAGFARDLTAERAHLSAGHFGLDSGPTWRWYGAALAQRLLGLPLLALAVAGLARPLLAREARGRLVAVTVLAYLGVVATWTMRAERYLLPVLPALLALAAAVAEALVQRVVASRPRWIRGAAWAGALALLLLPLAGRAASTDLRDRFRPDTRSLARRWLEGHAPEGSLIAMESYGPELNEVTRPELFAEPEVAARLLASPARPPLYAVQPLPMFQVSPERSAPYYDPGLYRDFDWIVVTSSVRDRYRAAPGRFARQCAFYDSLDRAWQLAAEFPATGHTGPGVRIYAPRVPRAPFFARDSVDAPGAFAGAGDASEGAYFWSLGVAYESAGHLRGAIACYRTGLAYPPAPEQTELYGTLAARLAWCELRLRGLPAALDVLELEARRATFPDEARAILEARTLLATRPGAFEALQLPRLTPRVRS